MKYRQLLGETHKACRALRPDTRKWLRRQFIFLNTLDAHPADLLQLRHILIELGLAGDRQQLKPELIFAQDQAAFATGLRSKLVPAGPLWRLIRQLRAFAIATLVYPVLSLLLLASGLFHKIPLEPSAPIAVHLPAFIIYFIFFRLMWRISGRTLAFKMPSALLIGLRLIVAALMVPVFYFGSAALIPRVLLHMPLHVLILAPLLLVALTQLTAYLYLQRDDLN